MALMNEGGDRVADDGHADEAIPRLGHASEFEGERINFAPFDEAVVRIPIPFEPGAGFVAVEGTGSAPAAAGWAAGTAAGSGAGAGAGSVAGDATGCTGAPVGASAAGGAAVAGAGGADADTGSVPPRVGGGAGGVDARTGRSASGST